MPQRKVIFDIGEIGWSHFHAAHIKYIRKVKEVGIAPTKYGINLLTHFTVYTFPDRKKLYNCDSQDEMRFINIETLHKDLMNPKDIRSGFSIQKFNGRMFKGKDLSGWLQYYNIRNEELSLSFSEFFYPRGGVLPYRGELLFEPFTTTAHEKDLLHSLIQYEECKNIVIFPRFKTGFVYYDKRNWPLENWVELVNLLVLYTDLNIIICGNSDYTYEFENQYIDNKRITNVSRSKFPLELTIAALNDSKTVLSVSTQSFGPTLSLLQRCNTLVWGHDKERLERDVDYPNSFKKNNIKYEYIDGDVDIYNDLPVEIVFRKIIEMI